jgi:hypothetical protein
MQVNIVIKQHLETQSQGGQSGPVMPPNDIEPVTPDLLEIVKVIVHPTLFPLKFNVGMPDKNRRPR